ncbi:MAG: toprim domain-containing protein [Bryobacterales bacterium]|nr:toprim domain-containing protein [Bryobacterales bacterium]
MRPKGAPGRHWLAVRKHRGFWLPPPREVRPARLLLTESAVDALSASLLPQELPAATLIASTAGIARRIPAWLCEFRASAVLCGYDSDEPGQLAAEALQGRHPGMRRLRPPRGKDRNELLQSGR